MREFIHVTAYILLVIGTIGLLINELIVDWGRGATLTFAIINIVGLVSLAYTHFIKRKT